MLTERHQWHAFDRIVELAPPLILGRVGTQHPEAPPPILPDISSTRVRALLRKRSEPLVRRELEVWVPAAVLDYVEAQQLYL